MKQMILLLTIFALLLFARALPLHAFSPATNGNLVDVIIGFNLTPGPVEERLVEKAGGRIKYQL
jgi:hypothetical protein